MTLEIGKAAFAGAFKGRGFAALRIGMNIFGKHIEITFGLTGLIGMIHIAAY